MQARAVRPAWAAAERPSATSTASTPTSTTSSTIRAPALGMFYRWRTRDIAAMCGAKNVDAKIHVSVLERVAHGTEDYSPGNLPGDAKVIFTPPPNAANAELAERRAAAAQRVLATIPGGTLLARVRTEMAAGRLWTYIYIVTGLVFLSAAWRTAQRSLAQPEGAAGVPRA